MPELKANDLEAYLSSLFKRSVTLTGLAPLGEARKHGPNEMALSEAAKDNSRVSYQRRGLGSRIAICRSSRFPPYAAVTVLPTGETFIRFSTQSTPGACHAARSAAIFLTTESVSPERITL